MKGKRKAKADADAVELGEACEVLVNPRANYESLLSTLKGLKIRLQQAPQDVDSLKNLGPSLSAGLLQAAEHSEKDVKLLTAYCLGQVLRIYAPDTPFTDNELKDVFQLLIWSLGSLEDVGSPAFDTAVAILQLTEQVKFYLLLLDLEPLTMVSELLRTLLGSIRDENAASVEHSVVEIFAGIIGEAGSDAGDILSDAMIGHLLKGVLGRLGPGHLRENTAQSRITNEILQRSEDAIRPHIQRYLTSAINNGGLPYDVKGAGQENEGVVDQSAAIGSKTGHALESARRSVYKSILKLYGTAPQILLPVMPHIGAELDSEEENRRKDALQLVYQILTLFGADFVEQYSTVVDRFMKRYIDHRVEIRLYMLNHSASLVSSAPNEHLRQQVLSAASGRLQDPADSVRAAACRVVCEMAAADLSQASLPALESVGRRLRDLHGAVRKDAATGLVSVFRSFVTYVMKNGFSDVVDQMALWIPGRLLWCSLHNNALRSEVMAALSTPQSSLFPSSADVNTCAQIWVAAYDQASDIEKDAILKMLAMKCKAQASLSAYLRIRAQLKSKSQEQNRASLERHAGRLMLGLVEFSSQSDRSTGQEIMTKLSQVKDQKIFDRLSTLCDMGLSEKQACDTRKDLLERLGSKTPVADFMSSVVDMVQANLLSADQLRMVVCILDPNKSTAVGQASADVDGKSQHAPGARTVSPALLHSTQRLVNDCSKAAGALLGPSLPYLSQLIVDVYKKSSGSNITKDASKSKRSRKVKESDEDRRMAAQKQDINAHIHTDAGKSLVVMLKALARGIKLSHVLPELDDQLLQELVSCMESICTGGPSKAAKWAPVILRHLSPLIEKQQSKGLKNNNVLTLSRKLMNLLQPSSACDPSTPAIVEAMSSIGWVQPESLGENAIPLVEFVTHNFLSANLGGDTHPMEDSDTTTHGDWGSPSTSVAAKVAAIKAVSRALCPLDGDASLPRAFGDAAASLIHALEALLDIENDMDDLGATTEHEKGHIRLGAATALLRMGIRYDSRITPQIWVSLSLAMQDPLAEVRSAFGSKLCGYVVSQMQLGASGRLPKGTPAWLVTKYAAMLPLAGMDPTSSNLEAAARQLRDFATVKRLTALRQQQQEAQRQTLEEEDFSKKGGMHSNIGYPSHPEFILPFVIYILAHHPDVPEFGPAADPEAMQPFCIMLQLCLEPLLAPSGVHVAKGKAHQSARIASTVSGQDACASLPMVLKALRHIRAMEDADKDQRALEQICGLCDLATEIALAIGRRWTRRLAATQARGANRQKQLCITRQEQLQNLGSYPGSIVLPKSLYQAPAGRQLVDSSTLRLPAEFHVRLERHICKSGCQVQMPEGMRDDATGEKGEASDEYGSVEGGEKNAQVGMEVDSAHKPSKRAAGDAGPARPDKKKTVGGGPGSGQKKKKGKEGAKREAKLTSPSAPSRAMPKRATRAQQNMADESSSEESD